MENMEKAAIPSSREQPASAFARTRDPHIDVMKGIGMLLVLVFHLQTVPYLGYSIIGYSAMFIMPLFFFVSGYLFPFSSDAGLAYGAYLRKKVLTLLVPYVVFFGISFLWTETIYAYATGTPLFGFGVDGLQMILAFLLAGEYLYNLAVVPFPLWFLHALFLTSLVFFLVVKIKRKLLIAAIAFVLALMVVPLQTALAGSPLWFVRLLPLALCYMLLGYLFRYFVSFSNSLETINARRTNIPVVGLISMLCFLFGLYCMRLGGGEMWSIASYWHFPGALACILGCYLFSRCTDNRILQFVGQASILYLGLHPFVTQLPFVAGLPDWFARQGFDGIIVYLGYFVVAFLLITVLVVAAIYLQKSFRRLIHRRK